MSATKHWIFQGLDRSHFSGKLRAAIRYKQIHCLEYPVDREDVKARTGKNFIPILISPDDETFQDSTDIIDELERRFPEPALIPKHLDDQTLCRLFELYADEFFLLISMRTRWGYAENEEELRRAIAASTGSLDMGNQLADRMSGYLPMLGITTNTIPAIDDHKDECLTRLEEHLTQHDFLLGGRMTLADCALVGPLFAHLYLDRLTRQWLLSAFPHVCMWIERCNRPVPEKMTQTFCGQYPDSLNALLKLIASDALPVLMSMQAAFADYPIETRPGEPIAGGFGNYEAKLRSAQISAAVRPYAIWKIQRLADALQVASEKRSATTEFLKGVGADILRASQDVPRLSKSGFELILSD